uniref:RNA-directed DNA polymerase n=1 Tax=Strongyloides papillosus TaxID=174720 RepID=A0A0N5BY74_STREA
MDLESKKDKRVEKFEMRFPMMEVLRFDKYHEENIITFASLEKDDIMDDLDKVSIILEKLSGELKKKLYLMKSPEDIIKMCWSSKGITEGLKELLLREFGGFQNPLVRFIELMNGDLDSDDPEDALTELQTKYAVLKPKLSDDKVLIGMFMNFLEKSNSTLCMEIKEVFREKIVKQQFTEVSADKTDKIAKVAKLEFQNKNGSFNKTRKVDYKRNQTYFRRNVTGNSEIICYKCNGKNHLSINCNSKFGLNVTCEECGGKGHYTNNCPNVKKAVKKLHSKILDDSGDVAIDDENKDFEDYSGVPSFRINKLARRDFIYETKWVPKFVSSLEKKQQIDLVSLFSDIENVKNYFVKLFSGGIGLVPHEFKLTLKENIKPVFFKTPRNIPYALVEATKEKLREMERENIIEKCYNPTWGSPIMVVQKTNNMDDKIKVRITGDYSCTVNPFLEDFNSIIPDRESIFCKLQGNYYSTLDLSDAFWNIGIEKESRDLTTIVTPWSCYRFKRLPQGLKVSPLIFQCYLESQLNPDMLEEIVIYQDDIIIITDTLERNRQLVFDIMTKLESLNLRLSKDKLLLFKKEVKFLGCWISAKGRKICTERYNHFKALKFPETLKDLETFQGLLSYFASYLVGLYKFKECFELEKVKVKNNKIIPTTMQLEYFAEITKQLSSDNAVVHYSLKEKLLLACDSSENIMGATLFHVYSDNSRKPIISACKTLTSFEKKYDIASKEALAIVYFVQRFNQYLRCRKFEIECDNRAVTCIFQNNKNISKLAAKRIARYRLILSHYDFSIKLIRSKDNVLPDALSRLIDMDKVELFKEEEVLVSALSDSNHKNEFMLLKEELPSSVNISELIFISNEDEVVNKVKGILSGNGNWDKKSRNLEEQFLLKNRFNLDVLDNILLVKNVPYIPKNFRLKLLQDIHGMEHYGITTMLELSKKFEFPLKKEIISSFIKSCNICQKSGKKPKFVSDKWPEALYSFHRCHIDYLKYDGKDIILLVDAYSGWIAAKITNKSSSEETIEFGFLYLF